MTQNTIIKPITLQFHPSGDTYRASMALGTYSVKPSKNLWVPQLNDAPFPVLFPDSESAMGMFMFSQSLVHDVSLKADWTQKEDGYTQTNIQGQWDIVPSQGSVEGWMLLFNGEPAPVGFTDEKSAMESCQAHLAILWYSLTDFQ